MPPESRWDLLPTQILVMIFSCLQIVDLTQVSKVCISWLRAFYQPQLHRRYHVDLADNVESLLEHIKAVRACGLFLGRCLDHVYIRFPASRQELETEPILTLYVSSLLQMLRLSRSPKLTRFELELNFSNKQPRCTSDTYRQLIVKDMSFFLEAQPTLNYLSLRNSFFSTNFFETVLAAMGRSSARRNLETLDIVNLYEMRLPTRILTGQLNDLFNCLECLSKVYLNYLYLKLINLEEVCLKLRNTLQWLIIVVDESNVEDSSNNITSDHWKHARRLCPRLKVKMILPNGRYNLLNFLIPDMPLAEVVANYGFSPVYETEYGNAATLLLYHLGHHFRRTLRTVQLSTSTEVKHICTPAKESIVALLKSCRTLQEVSFSPDLMTRKLLEEISAEIHKDLGMNTAVLKINPI